MDQPSGPYLISIQCDSIYELIPRITPTLASRIIQEEIIKPDIPWAYFGGASNAHDCCGARIIIHINDHKILKASVGIGTGSNNYDELKTLKIRLCWLRQLGISSAHIFGGSMNVINWSKKCSVVKILH